MNRTKYGTVIQLLNLCTMTINFDLQVCLCQNYFEFIAKYRY